MANAMEANDVDTEQTLSCLQLKMYHPHHEYDQRIFSAFNLGRKEEMQAEQTVLFGRDIHSCKFAFLNNRVSRMQFSLQLFKPLHSSKLAFEIKNLSKKTKLQVNGEELGYLNKMELPPKCMISFGDFQMLAETEEGESEDKFSVCCQVSQHSLVQDLSGPVRVGIPETGLLNGEASLEAGISSTPPPVEVDENDL
ncbi:TRAF-interacting protein with FHA domain-containing protein A [Gastrophryne carolinensis]